MYQAYKTPIDNTTFKVEWEKLTDQKWVKLPESTSCLFNTKNKHTSPRGKLSEYSEIVYDKPFKNITVSTEEEQYQYTKAQQGFFRIRLTRSERRIRADGVPDALCGYHDKKQPYP